MVRLAWSASIHSVDSFPNLAGLTDQELSDLVKQLIDAEMEVSYKRRILQAKIDILRAELTNRIRKRGESGGPGSAPTREPRRPSPRSGAGAISLPKPEDPHDDERDAPARPLFDA
jgi:hypothetical protein